MSDPTTEDYQSALHSSLVALSNLILQGLCSQTSKVLSTTLKTQILDAQADAFELLYTETS